MHSTFLYKIGPDGTTLWDIDFLERDLWGGVTVDYEGDVLLSTNDSTNDGPVFLTKIAQSGVVIWEKVVVNDGYSDGKSAVDSKGNIYVSSYVKNIEFCCSYKFVVYQHSTF